VEGPLLGVPISGCLGDQQAALVGQLCFNQGDAKNTLVTFFFRTFFRIVDCIIFCTHNVKLCCVQLADMALGVFCCTIQGMRYDQ